MTTYVVDSNFFIQAHRATYPLDVVPSFWIKLKDLAGTGKIVSIDKVKKEIFDHQDDLKEWCKNNLPKEFFKNTQTSQILSCYSQVANWANSKSSHYAPSALSEFLDADEADAWLVSFALQDVTNTILVTHEKSEPAIKRKIKIPEACTPFGIKHVTTIEMLRELRVQL
jgi:hypothetical protein